MEVHGREYQLTPITLRTVRPMVLDSMILSDVAEAGQVDLNDRSSVTKMLKTRVNIAPLYFAFQCLTSISDRRVDRRRQEAVG